jgi:flagellum-specific ATP synthase
MTATATLAARLDELAAMQPGVGPRPSGQVVAYDGFLIEASGLAASTGALCTIHGDGPPFDAEVIGFREDRQQLMSLEPAAHVRPDARVVLAADDPAIGVGEGLLGRSIDARGRPIDGGPLPLLTDRWPLRGRPQNPLGAPPIRARFDVGIRAIDALLTLGRGQRVGIVAGSGVGKSTLLGMITRFAAADVVIIGLVGERGREVADFLDKQISPAARRRTVVVAVPASHSPALRLRGAQRATAIAEYFRSIGRNVLLIIDSLTRVAHAQREIGLALGEHPTAKGYPPSVFNLIPALVERAGNHASGGSITAVYTVLADGDDVDADPVVDAARAILDGHVVLSRSIAERAIYPAIDISKSISRVMDDLVTPEQAEQARHVRRLNAAFEENRDLVLLGAYQRGQDPVLDQAIARRPAIERFVAQSVSERVPRDDALRALAAIEDA